MSVEPISEGAFMNSKTLITVLTGLALCGGSVLAIQPESAKPAPKDEKPASQPADAPAKKPEAKRPDAKKPEAKTTNDFPTSMPIPPDAAKQGTVYYMISGKSKQITVTSEVAGAKTDWISNNATGYAVLGADHNPSAIKTMVWSMPVKSLDTRAALPDDEMAIARWLEADKQPV